MRAPEQTAPLRLLPAHRPPLLDEARALFREYADWLGVDLGFQGFEQELASLPGKYTPPAGCMVVAVTDDGTALGCVAVRPMDQPGVCEMKRLWTRPAARGQGLGTRLARYAMDRARDAGYTLMRLDTLASMTLAVRLYEGLGFERIPPYYHNPLPDVVYLQRRLDERPNPF